MIAPFIYTPLLFESAILMNDICASMRPLFLRAGWVFCFVVEIAIPGNNEFMNL